MINFIIQNGDLTRNAESENVTRESFWNLYVPGCDEHYTLHRIWSHPDFIPELYFVAMVADKIVGCIVFTKSALIDPNGVRLEIVTFGPVCVLPDYQHQGIGAALITRGIAKAKEMGYPAIVILGDPHNYCKHGFRNAKDLTISDSDGNYPLGQLALALDDERFVKGSWKFVYSDVYNIDPNEVARFDEQFPPKEKMERHSQCLFNMLIRAHID